MRIRADNIPGEGQRIEGTIDPSTVGLGMPGISLIEPLAFAGRATRNGENIIVEGELTGAMELQCGRCLNSFNEPFDLAMRFLFAPEEESAAGGEGGFRPGVRR